MFLTSKKYYLNQHFIQKLNCLSRLVFYVFKHEREHSLCYFFTEHFDEMSACILADMEVEINTKQSTIICNQSSYCDPKGIASDSALLGYCKRLAVK